MDSIPEAAEDREQTCMTLKEEGSYISATTGPSLSISEAPTFEKKEEDKQGNRATLEDVAGGKTQKRTESISNLEEQNEPNKACCIIF